MASRSKPKSKRAKQPQVETPADVTLRRVVDFEIPHEVLQALRSFDGSYDGNIADCVLRAVSEGMTLLDACLVVGIRKGHFNAWLRDDEQGLCARYREALRQQAESWSDEIVQIADNAIAHPPCIAQAKMRIDVRQWLMQRNNARFGEKSTVVHEGNPLAPQQVVTAEMTPEQAAEAWARVRQPEQST